MSNTNFTKGEWCVNALVNGRGFDISFNDDDGECVVEIVHDEHDAHLMAASKKMYAMLEKLQLSVADEIERDELLKSARGES